MEKKFEFDAKCFRVLPHPYAESGMGNVPTIYQAYVEIHDLPSDFPMKTNPREQNMNTRVAKIITESILTPDETFHIKNRGIVLSAESVSYDQKTKRISIVMTDDTVHGNIDGGHTYKIILNQRDNIENKQYVKLEVITGSEDFFTELAAARNTSVQVPDTSIAELEQKFEPLKENLPKYILDNMAFKQNENKRIGVDDVLSLLSCFDLSKYNGDVHPISAYSQKGSAVKEYIKYYDEDEKNGTKNNPYVKMGPIIEDILKLYDKIEVKYPTFYREAFTGGKIGAIKAVGYKDGKKFKTLLYDNDTNYNIPKGFMIPILAAFRCLVVEKDGEYHWRDDVDVFKYLDKYGSQLVKFTIERFKSLGNNPNALGKDTGHWSYLYSYMFSNYKDEFLEQMGLTI